MASQEDDNPNALLAAPSNDEYPSLNRTPSVYNPLHSYNLPKGDNRQYQQQYADMYFARLAQLKPAVEAIATESFSEVEVAGEMARKVERVLDVRQGELCWVVGTAYMEMPLKPNVLEDIGKEHWIAAPPPRVKYGDGGQGLETGPAGTHSGTQGVGTQTMLEDESGRLRLTGGYLQSVLLVTGAIVAVLGTENADGDFEVLDLRVPDLPRQPQRWERDEGDAAPSGNKVTQDRAKVGKVAIVSGLGISGDTGDTLSLDLLMEYLLGESTSPSDQAEAANISRLVIAGNSLVNSSPIPTRQELAAVSKNRGIKKYGYDSSSYNSAPTDSLDIWLASLLPSLPITLLPGDSDPTGTSLPQQPIHAAMFPHSRAYMEWPLGSAKEASWFDSQTNPAEFDIDGYRFLGTGGQPVDDVFKYVAGDERLEMMESMLRWRLTAPTAPDTLWCYPFQDGDQFVLKECPHVFVVGNQPKFETTVIEGPRGEKVRLITVPSFRETGEVVIMDMETLVPELIKFEVFEGG